MNTTKKRRVGSGGSKGGGGLASGILSRPWEEANQLSRTKNTPQAEKKKNVAALALSNTGGCPREDAAQRPQRIQNFLAQTAE